MSQRMPDYESLRAQQARAQEADRVSHGMLPGSHERGGGPECRCGAPWSRWHDLCLVQFKATEEKP